MKALLINGSPRAKGCTYTALTEVGQALNRAGIDTELFQLGSKPVRGCVACGGCDNAERCAFGDDQCNALIEAILAADAIVVGSPVYYAGPNGALCALLDRAFFAASGGFRGKVAAAVVSCRRAGSTAALDRLNKYFTISQMPVAPSQYWNMVHGKSPEEVRQDQEGMQIMRTLGANMAHMLKSLSGNLIPASTEERLWTNFIR